MSTAHAYWDYHLHHLLLNGVCKPGESPFYDDVRSAARTRFRRFNFQIENYRYDTIQRDAADTPYTLVDRRLHFRGRALHRLPFALLAATEEEWGSERAWWFKAFPTLDQHYDLRLNPINTCANLKFRSGEEQDLRGCVFCHRCYDQPRVVERRAVVSLPSLFADIESVHGPDVFSRIAKVMVVTGDVDSEDAMLDLLESAYHEHLVPKGFVGVFSAVTTLIRSPHGLRRLAALDNTLFEFPVECFTRRTLILGERKGLPMEAVEQVLSIARGLFKSIRLNYLVGLDPLPAIAQGFSRLRQNGLVDDVISNIFVPYDARALRYRQGDSFDMNYIYGYRRILHGLSLGPRRTGATKDAFSPFVKTMMEDELVPYRKTINIVEHAI